MDRFKLSFKNSRPVNRNYNNNVAPNISSTPIKPSAPQNSGLNTPMIGRVYKARPGCSACGKKVA